MEFFTSTDGTTIHYSVLGQGRPVIFLHGWTEGANQWLPFAQELAEHCQVFCWDARGHGGHAVDPECDACIPRMADDLHQLIEHRKLNDIVLVGHSMGALTAWEYISRYGCDALSGLCTIDQSPRLITDQHWPHGVYGEFNNSRNVRFTEQLEADFPATVLALIGEGNNARSQDNYQRNSRGFQNMREYLATLPEAQMVQCWRSLTRVDLREVMPRIDVPVLLIHGDESQFYSQELAHWLAEQIPQAQLHIYEESDHSPHLWHRELFVSQLSQFVNGL